MDSKIKYIVRLDSAERTQLETIVKKLKGTAQKVKRAIVLLKADADGPNWTNEKISDLTGMSLRAITNIRKRLVLEGLEIVLNRKQRTTSPRKKILDGKQEAQIIAMRLGSPPEGFAKWSLRLLAERAVELKIVETIGKDTIRRTLKKKGLTKQKSEYWVIPPGKNEEFVASMEEVLEVYHRPFDPRFPVICMDEQPVQLLKEVKAPIPARAASNGHEGHPERIDYEYERNGTACIFMFIQPLGGWRKVLARPHRTKLDWAEEIGKVVFGDFPDAERITFVQDNLNTHTKGALYSYYPPELASKIVRRCEFVYTPIHGSWLNIAESELSVLTRQCLSRRIGDLETLRRELLSWTSYRNTKQVGVDWQFTTDDARIKLKSLYPEYIFQTPKNVAKHSMKN